jgi:hypothetical protein
MLLNFDGLATMQNDHDKVLLLRDLKNDLVGDSDTKQAYFDAGILETLIPLTESKTTTTAVLFEILATINCFFFEVPKACDCFEIHKD